MPPDLKASVYFFFTHPLAQGAEDDHQRWIRTYAQETVPGSGIYRFMLKNKKSEMDLHADWHKYFTNGHIKKTLDDVEQRKLS